MKTTANAIKDETVVSKDGTTIGYKIIGTGPGLLMIHGSYRSAKHYLRLADYLKSHFTVYIMDRRGRGKSGQQGAQYAMGKEVEDAQAIVEKHHIEYVFGHSFGGIVCFNLSFETKLKKIAVYEPGMSADNSLPLKWVPKFEKQLKKEDYVGAMVSMTKGLGLAGFLNSVPDFVLKFFFKILSRANKDWDNEKVLLHLVPAEILAGKALDPFIDRYRKIDVPVLLLGGSKSADWLLTALKALQNIIPNAKIKIMDGLVHNAPDEFAPEKVGAELLAFFKE